MPRARQPAATPRAGVTFEVERLEISDGSLVISGHWSGVRGMRFVRPTLVAGGRRVLATLEHKPWSRAGGKPWTAAFAWEGADFDVEDMSLTVAPTVTVRLGSRSAAADGAEALMFVGETETAPAPALAAVPEDGGDGADAAPAAADPSPAPARSRSETASPARLLRLQDDLAALAHERDALQQRLEEAQARNAELDQRCQELEETARLQRRAAQDAGESREDLERARTAAERDRDRTLAQVEEAVQDREAAVRTRARMEIQRDEAVQAREAAEARLGNAIADRDEANAQRDEVLLAYDTLQRQLVGERADADRERPPRTRSERAAEDRAGVDAERELPLGVRTMPAARTVTADLQRRLSTRKLPVSKFDLWVMRVLGTVAALCFISLLVMILRVFI